MTDLSIEQSSYLLQLFHPEKYWPGLAEGASAPLFGVDAASYQSVRATFAARASQAASDLLSDPIFAGHVDRLPFEKGSTVVALGDSITDDLQSWAEILRHLLALRRPQDQISVVNAGVSGETTSHIIGRFPGIIQQQPDWLIFMAGTNDASTFAQSPAGTQVSLEETARNLRMLRTYAAAQSRARWVWMTPPPVIESQIRADWFLVSTQWMWTNEHIRPVAALIRQQLDLVIDLYPVFGDPANPDLMLPDGLHPSLAGQKAIATALVERLSGERV